MSDNARHTNFTGSQIHGGEANSMRASMGAGSGLGVSIGPSNAGGGSMMPPPAPLTSGNSGPLIRPLQQPHPDATRAIIPPHFTSVPILEDTPVIPRTIGSGRLGSRARLEVGNNLNDMTVGWSQEEWNDGRRLVKFWRNQSGTNITILCDVLHPSAYDPSTIVVSCIFSEEKNECYITSVDMIYLLEAIIHTRFVIEEKNRIRRNLEGFRPITLSKTKWETERLFKRVMGFVNPKPRNIEKDVKVFPWKVLEEALKKIVNKYCATSEPSPSNPTPFFVDELSVNGREGSSSSGGRRPTHRRTASVGSAPYQRPSHHHHARDSSTYSIREDASTSTSSAGYSIPPAVHSGAVAYGFSNATAGASQMPSGHSLHHSQSFPTLTPLGGHGPATTTSADSQSYTTMSPPTNSMYAGSEAPTLSHYQHFSPIGQHQAAESQSFMPYPHPGAYAQQHHHHPQPYSQQGSSGSYQQQPHHGYQHYYAPEYQQQHQGQDAKASNSGSDGHEGGEMYGTTSSPLDSTATAAAAAAAAGALSQGGYAQQQP
ncbi:hypothetical protein BDZ90DRAFT_169614 [Jaminaea rosea]|uniref:DUF7082 domain-containing protein n=1 Tax=Jaminaea rosea TaxID=1569628 RepID=A0A316UQV5_9BASI|nr:hypothetical protein BDZ90DRAFT_169614 [Jaminaea rosea]PWN27689.1 hypothetical protein BDZ90DRAFT_169614 [Jaminaea rosea]